MWRDNPSQRLWVMHLVDFPVHPFLDFNLHLVVLISSLTASMIDER